MPARLQKLEKAGYHDDWAPKGGISFVFDELIQPDLETLKPRTLKAAAKLNALCQTEIVEVFSLYRTDIVEDIFVQTPVNRCNLSLQIYRSMLNTEILLTLAVDALSC